MVCCSLFGILRLLVIIFLGELARLMLSPGERNGHEIMRFFELIRGRAKNEFVSVLKQTPGSPMTPVEVCYVPG
jgi:hypothetical protein